MEKKYKKAILVVAFFLIVNNSFAGGPPPPPPLPIDGGIIGLFAAAIFYAINKIRNSNK